MTKFSIMKEPKMSNNELKKDRISNQCNFFVKLNKGKGERHHILLKIYQMDIAGEIKNTTKSF